MGKRGLGKSVWGMSDQVRCPHLLGLDWSHGASLEQDPPLMEGRGLRPREGKRLAKCDPAQGPGAPVGGSAAWLG